MFSVWKFQGTEIFVYYDKLLLDLRWINATGNVVLGRSECFRISIFEFQFEFK